MSLALSQPHPSAPSEDWDDDFDFQQQSGSPKRRRNNTHDPLATTRMSTATEDWDVDNATTTSLSHHDATQTNSILTDKLNIDSPNLKQWAESNPLTPHKQRAAPQPNTETWDDDFFDKCDYPAHRSTLATPRTGVGNKKHGAILPQVHNPVHVDDGDEHESWDDEFDFNDSPAKASKPSTPGKSRRTPSRPSRKKKSSTQPIHDDSSDDDDDFGMGSGDDDRTVTARSKHLPQSHSHTPPPPVPSIPFNMPSFTTATSNAPFPGSPTMSVFSVPASSIADAQSFHSTDPLRPSLSRGSGGHVFRHLPPSPPIHRERRRLRKKSRPQPQGMIELQDVQRRYPLSDAEIDDRIVEEEFRPISPPMNSGGANPTTPQTPPSQSTSAGGALLSRIGSVKRWTVRRKRASTASADVESGREKGKNDIPSPGDNDVHLTPRLRSSLSSLLHSNPTSTNPPPPSSSWFFRSSSPTAHRRPRSRGRPSLGSSNKRSSATGSHSGSMTDLSMRSSIYAASSVFGEDELSVHKTPNKLVKRKSLGLVQLQKGLGGSNASSQRDKQQQEISDSSLEFQMSKSSSKRPMSMQAQRLPSGARQMMTQRHASYGASKSKNIDIDELRERPNDITMAKEQNENSVKEDDKRNQATEGKPEGSRGFMGSVRRLSIVGRHKRRKSALEMLTRLSSESSSAPPVPSQNTVPDQPPSLPPLPAMAAEIEIARPKTPIKDSAPALLPPIELQPPSPPKAARADPDTMDTSPIPSADLFSPPSFRSFSPVFSPSASNPLPSKSSPSVISPKSAIQSLKSPSSPQSASLGRSTISPSVITASNSNVPRRNSLSDLKIPARISQAQVGLKRDLNMVRDFALYIEQLKKQQDDYHELVSQVKRKLDLKAQLHAESQPQPSRAVSPSFFNNITRSKTRARSSTNPNVDQSSNGYGELATGFHTINSKYRISWECAELLIELANGTSATSALSPPLNAPTPVTLNPSSEKRGRERAITLAGDESKPPTPIPGVTHSVHPNSISGPGPPPVPSPTWRASTGRHDLTQRQLALLQEMLNNAEALLLASDPGLTLSPEMPSADDPSASCEWKWGDPMSSTITLPPENRNEDQRKQKRRMSRLGAGISGLREMLKALRKQHTDTRDHPIPAVPNHAMLSTLSLSTDTSYEPHSSTQHLPAPSHDNYHRQRKTSTGPEVAQPGKGRGRDSEPKSSPTTLATKASPRRPSLASIFRLGLRSNSNKNASTSTSNTDLSIHLSNNDSRQADNSRPPTSIGSIQGSSTGEEDWDRMDSASDMDVAAKALGIGTEGGSSTVRIRKGKSPYLQQYHAPSSSGQLPRPVTPRRSASGSQLSLWAESPSKSKSKIHLPTPAPRAKRLSDVEETAEGQTPGRNRRPVSRGKSPGRPSGKIVKSGSVRSMPPQAVITEPRIAMTPENIKPLLENAKEVHARLADCIMEIKRLLELDEQRERAVSSSTSASEPSSIS